MSISASEARKMLSLLIERVNEDRTAVEIISRKGNAVLMPADEYAAWQETAYLFRSPANPRRKGRDARARPGGLSRRPQMVPTPRRCSMPRRSSALRVTSRPVFACAVAAIIRSSALGCGLRPYVRAVGFPRRIRVK